MSKIRNAFQQGKACIPFITCGDPDLETTAAVVRQAAVSGADLVILGIPFSDPTAEGLVIQEASIRALKGGVTADKIFEMVKELRRDMKLPLAVMTYANVVFSYGTDRFLAACGQIGIDGLIVPDIPYEEKEEILPSCRTHGVDLISLAVPAAESRIARIAGEAEGFLYITSSLGAAEAKEGIVTDLGEIVSVAKQNTDIPCVIGFEIASPEQAARAARVSDGVIIESGIVTIVGRYQKDAAPKAGEYIKQMKAAMEPAVSR